MSIPIKAQKTPSAKVLAAKVLQAALAGAVKGIASRTTGFSEFTMSRVTDAKREKVLAQMATITKSFQARIDRIVERFDHPPPKPAKAKAGQQT